MKDQLVHKYNWDDDENIYVPQCIPTLHSILRFYLLTAMELSSSETLQQSTKDFIF